MNRQVERARAARLFHALSDETRLALLEMLSHGERCVCELQDELDAAQSRLSFHLRVLKDAGLVTDRAWGTRRIYQLSPDGIAGLRAYLDRIWGYALASFSVTVESTSDSPENEEPTP